MAQLVPLAAMDPKMRISTPHEQPRPYPTLLRQNSVITTTDDDDEDEDGDDEDDDEDEDDDDYIDDGADDNEDEEMSEGVVDEDDDTAMAGSDDAGGIQNIINGEGDGKKLLGRQEREQQLGRLKQLGEAKRHGQQQQRQRRQLQIQRFRQQPQRQQPDIQSRATQLARRKEERHQQQQDLDTMQQAIASAMTTEISATATPVATEVDTGNPLVETAAKTATTADIETGLNAHIDKNMPQSLETVAEAATLALSPTASPAAIISMGVDKPAVAASPSTTAPVADKTNL